MQRLLILFFLLFFASAFARAQTVSSVFSCLGKQYSLKFTDEDVADTPSLDRNRPPNPSLSRSQALEIATRTLDECHPTAPGNWQLSTSYLIPMGVDKWVYVLRFKCPFADCTNDKNHYGVYVTLNGKVLRPKPGAETIEVPVSFEFGQNLEKRDCRKRFASCRLDEYTSLIAANPKNVVAYFNRGLAYRIDRKYDEAISDFTKVIQLDPLFPQIYSNRGVTYSIKKEYDLAIADYDKAIELDSRSNAGYYGRGSSYHSKGAYEKALQDYAKAIELAPQEWLYRYVRGWLYYNIGSKDLAKQDFAKAKALAVLEENVDTVRLVKPTYPDID